MMNKGNLFLIADLLDMVSFALINNGVFEETLQVIYLVLLIASMVAGLVLKIISFLRDGKLTKEEIADLKKELDESLETIKKLKEDEEEKEDK